LGDTFNAGNPLFQQQIWGPERLFADLSPPARSPPQGVARKPHAVRRPISLCVAPPPHSSRVHERNGSPVLESVVADLFSVWHTDCKTPVIADHINSHYRESTR
jgi:hypothetical protein